MTPKSYKIRFIEPGIISYNDSGAGTVLVSREALDRMAQSFRNCPVIFVPEQHDNSDPETAFNFDDIGANRASGIVTGFPYWEDGWQWVDVSVWDEGAQDAIDNRGYSASCAYTPTETGDGGKWHDLLYDEEVLNGEYMHMAIVPRPRYEGSQILANSKGGPSVALFGIGKKNAEPAGPAAKPEPAIPEKKEEPEMLNADATVDVNGTPVPLYELIEAYQMKQGSGNVPPALTPEDEVALPDGSKVKVAELIAAYGPGEGEPMDNAEPAQNEPGEPAVKPLTNAAPAKPEPKKVNAALKNAATRGDDIGANGGVETEGTRLKRGEARYSLAVQQGGK